LATSILYMDRPFRINRSTFYLIYINNVLSIIYCFTINLIVYKKYMKDICKSEINLLWKKKKKKLVNNNYNNNKNNNYLLLFIIIINNI